MVLLWSDEAFNDVRIRTLHQQFPFIQIETKPIEELQNEHPNFCQQVDIVYASELSIEQLEAFPHVKWIHCPLTHLSGFPPSLWLKREDILVTRTLVQPSVHYFDFAATLLFASCQDVLFRGKQVRASSKPFSRTLVVHMGLGPCNLELAKRAKKAGLRTIGIASPSSFHSFYDKVLPILQLHSVLPAADVVIVTVSEEDEKKAFGQEEFALMKPGSSLFVLGEPTLVDSKALFNALKGKVPFQVWLDFSWEEEADEQKWEWKQFPRLLHTPGLIHSMDKDKKEDFHFFLWNLDCFYHRRYLEMNGLRRRAPARRLERRALGNL